VSEQPPQTGQAGPETGPAALAYFRLFTQVLNIAGTVLILLMALSVNFDVLGRNLFNKPIAGVNEFIGLSIVAVVFLQMANTLQEDRHVSNDIFIRLISGTHPRLSAGLYASFHFIGAALMAIVVIYVWPIVTENYRGGYYSGTAGIIEIPIWPFMLVIVVGAAATGIQFILDGWQLSRRAAAKAAER
jgi:TRAP-type mannitol/chloroaromatic compound transport system permease small subunit